MTRLCGDRGALANLKGFSSPRDGRLTSGRQLEELTGDHRRASRGPSIAGAAPLDPARAA
jgi:hypothetical protein